MAEPLQDLMRDDGAVVYYTESFRKTIEDHLDAMRTARSSLSIQVDGNIAYKFEYNFYGLLRHLQVSPYMHWITMRVNGYLSPDEYLGSHVVIVIPDPEYIEKLRSTHNTINKAL